MKRQSLITTVFVSLIGCALLLGGQAVAQTAATPANDEAVVSAVKSALAAKPELKASDLQVTSKNGGEVTIAGKVDSGSQLYKIADTAQKVPGVKWINNGMSVKE